METKEAIAWFKQTFGERMSALLEGTPFDADMVAAIANQETGYIWGPLAQKGLTEDEILRLCVGDTLDASRGRNCFPRTRAELVGATRGREMYTIAREALLEMAQHISGYESAVANEEKFCHGFGIFQYDLQFFTENPDYFLQKSWGDFEACLTQFIAELRAAAQRQGWARKATLTDDEKVFVAIAYNKGTCDCTRGFKQGHMSDGRCYGENVYEFLHTARSIPLTVLRTGARTPAHPARSGKSHRAGQAAQVAPENRASLRGERGGFAPAAAERALHFRAQSRLERDRAPAERTARGKRCETGGGRFHRGRNHDRGQDGARFRGGKIFARGEARTSGPNR